jgi:hypothetical protein
MRYPGLRPALLFGSSLAALVLGACAFKSGTEAAPGAVVMKIGGDGYVIQPLTAGTWTATPQTNKPVNESGKADLIRAIESTSGCKVTDSDFANGYRQFDAQVDCPGQIK